MKKTMICVICISLILLITVSGCISDISILTPSSVTIAPITPVPTATPAITEAPATPEPTPTTTPEPTPTIDPTIAQIYENIEDYLNKKGKYCTDLILERDAIDAEDQEGASDTKLGLIGTMPTVQGLFLDYLEMDDNLILFMGFQGKNDNRFVSPVEIPIYYLNHQELSFDFLELERNSMYSNPKDVTSIVHNGNEVSEKVKTLKGGIIAFELNYLPIPQEMIDEAIEKGFTIDSTIEHYIQDQSEKAGYTGKLISSLADNGVNWKRYHPDFSEEKFKDYEIIMIDDIGDLQKIGDMRNIDINKIPIVEYRISYVQ